MSEIIRFVGLDVHALSTSVAVADLHGEAGSYGSIATDRRSLAKLGAKLGGSGARLCFCYEAGPLGYEPHRVLTALGYDCTVVAPSLIPRRPGERVKTDRRDALKLARLHRAGELTAVWVPDPGHEAMRDLVRARAAAVRALRRCRQQLSGFLLRHGRRYSRKAWTAAHRRWLAKQRFDHPAQHIVLEDLIDAVEAAGRRRDALGAQIEAQLDDWSLAPLVRCLQALRGVAAIVAVTVVAELGDLHRFETPRQLMAYLGLTPSEHSSGTKSYRGEITKAGNRACRSALVEAAWTYRWPARRSPLLLARQEALPEEVKAIAWKAQIRLAGRYRRLMTRGKPSTVVSTAIARELAGFMWAISRAIGPMPAAG